eukprot:scaffold53039_cov27-Phaeocystis_antarctica.AAC.1
MNGDTCRYMCCRFRDCTRGGECLDAPGAGLYPGREPKASSWPNLAVAASATPGVRRTRCDGDERRGRQGAARLPVQPGDGHRGAERGAFPTRVARVLHHADTFVPYCMNQPPACRTYQRLRVPCPDAHVSTVWYQRRLSYLSGSSSTPC